MDKEALDNRRIEIGTDLEEWTLSRLGNFLLQLWEQKISQACAEAMLGKKDKKFIATTLEEFYFHRGFALGIQWVLDDIQGKINVAKRLAEEKKEKERNGKEQ